MTTHDTTEATLLLRRCAACGNVQHGWQDGYCIACWSTELQDVPASGRATLLSWATYHADFKLPDMEVPYHVGFIELEEGPRLPCHLLGDVRRARFEQPVEVRVADAVPSSSRASETEELTAYVVAPWN